MRSLMVLICGLCTTKQLLAEQLVSGVYRRCRSLTQQTLYKVQCTAGFESTLRKGKLLWTPCPWYQQYALLENVFVAGQEQTVKLAFQPAARSAVSAELRDVIIAACKDHLSTKSKASLPFAPALSGMPCCSWFTSDCRTASVSSGESAGETW